MSPETLLFYFVTWSLVAITPGPAVMCAMAQATRFGLRSSLAGITGIQAGNLLFFLCVASGLAALLAAATTAFTALRIVGAIYLCYLGTRIVVATFRRVPAARVPSVPSSPRPRSLFLQGLLVQVTNPKALLFVSALLPQFIDPGRPVILQLAILVLITVAVDCAVLSTYACVAARGAHSFRGSRLALWVERTFGAALACFGLRLLFTRK